MLLLVDGSWFIGYFLAGRCRNPFSAFATLLLTLASDNGQVGKFGLTEYPGLKITNRFGLELITHFIIPLFSRKGVEPSHWDLRPRTIIRLRLDVLPAPLRTCQQLLDEPSRSSSPLYKSSPTNPTRIFGFALWTLGLEVPKRFCCWGRCSGKTFF